MHKKHIRERIKRILESYDGPTIERTSERIRERLYASSWWKEADTILLYLCFRTEVITDHLVEAAISQGKQVGAPRVEGEQIRFYSIRSITDDCELSSMGIREPCAGSPPLDPIVLKGKRVLAIVPGRAFDRNGNRIGWGGGYYDRWIRSARSETELQFTAVALCFHDQVLSDLPSGPSDEPVDAVITERETISWEGRP